MAVFGLVVAILFWSYIGADINAAQRMASVGDKTITLSPLECKLLNYLAANANRAVPNGELLEIVWQCSSQADGKAAQVKNCVKRLRHKIEPDPGHPRYLVSVRRGGYRLAFEPVGIDDETPPKTVQVTPIQPREEV